MNRARTSRWRTSRDPALVGYGARALPCRRFFSGRRTACSAMSYGLVIDDHPLVARGVTAFLRAHPRLSDAVDAGDAEQARDPVRTRHAGHRADRLLAWQRHGAGGDRAFARHLSRRARAGDERRRSARRAGHRHAHRRARLRAEARVARGVSSRRHRAAGRGHLVSGPLARHRAHGSHRARCAGDAGRPGPDRAPGRHPGAAVGWFAQQAHRPGAQLV